MADEIIRIHIHDTIKAPGEWLTHKLDKHRSAKRIDIYVTSPGGAAFVALAWHAAIQNCPAKVRIIVHGLAASAATIFPMAADEVWMSDTALFMIHEPMSGAIGRSSDLKQEAGVIDKVNDRIVHAYTTRTRLPEARIRQMLDAETWLTADEAKQLGFIDRVIESDRPVTNLVKSIATAPEWALAIAANAALTPAQRRALDGQRDPTAAWRTAVAEKLTAGLTRHAAVAAVSAEQPALHARYVAAANSDRPKAAAIWSYRRSA